MAEKDTIFASNVKYTGIFNFKEYYNFCYTWIREELDMDIMEEKYEEVLTGEQKKIICEWSCTKELTDYFKFEMKVTFDISWMINVEINQGGKKVSTNKGGMKTKVKGILIRDYQGKYEKTAFTKFLRSIYEKWIITGRIEELEGKVFGDCDDFLNQSKAYFDLEGKK